MSETRNIDDMQPGRELDAMVSEALGIPESEWDPPCFWRHRTDDCSGKDATFGWDGWCYDCGMMVREVKGEPRRYSTENSVAIGLAETLPSFNIFVNYPIPASGNIHTNAGAMCDDMGCDETCADATTIAHAICLTFLKVIAATAHKP